LPSFAVAKDPPDQLSAHKPDKKFPALYWEPPNVDAPVSFIPGAPACSLPDVLKQAGQRAEELIGHLQDFAAHEQIRYVQTARLDMSGSTSSVGKSQMPYAQKNVLELSEMHVTANFEYQVDYGEQFNVLNVHETRTPLSATDDQRIAAIVSKGLPVLALIFSPALQSDYEMSCEGSALWNDHPAWVVHFRQASGKRPRTFKLETTKGTYPLSIKGRAWIAKDSGQVMHLETNLVAGILAIDLQTNALSVDYGPVKFQSEDVEVWLPETAIAYTDFEKRRMISEHNFADFQLFSVRTKEVIHPLQSHADAEMKNQPRDRNTGGELPATEKSGAEAGDVKSASSTPMGTPVPVSIPWSPVDVDANVPPVEPGSTCDLKELLQKAGAQIQEMVANLEHFTATESLLQETLNKSGKVAGKERRKYDYLVSIGEIRPGILSVQEDLNDGADSAGYPGGFVTKGLPALMLIFHPYYSDTFSMKCEGLAELNGERTWQIYFRQRPDKPNRVRAYSIGVNGPSNPVALKGRAWFVADTYQIARLQADLIESLPKIRLTVDHTDIEYGQVHSKSLGMNFWLPHTAELYTDFRGRRIHQRMSYTDYLLFAVEERQKISDPKVID
jgi:hypothetical protein